jgi:hypothetical protein
MVLETLKAIATGNIYNNHTSWIHGQRTLAGKHEVPKGKKKKKEVKQNQNLQAKRKEKKKRFNKTWPSTLPRPLQNDQGSQPHFYLHRNSWHNLRRRSGNQEVSELYTFSYLLAPIFLSSLLIWSSFDIFLGY